MARDHQEPPFLKTAELRSAGGAGTAVKSAWAAMNPRMSAPLGGPDLRAKSYSGDNRLDEAACYIAGGAFALARDDSNPEQLGREVNETAATDDGERVGHAAGVDRNLQLAGVQKQPRA